MIKSNKPTVKPKVINLISLSTPYFLFYFFPHTFYLFKNAYGEESEEEPDDEMPHDLVPIYEKPVPNPQAKNSRTSVSAEVYGQFNKKNEDYKPRFIQKNESQIERIKARISNVFMFSSLENKEVDMLISAFEEKTFK